MHLQCAHTLNVFTNFKSNFLYLNAAIVLEITGYSGKACGYLVNQAQRNECIFV